MMSSTPSTFVPQPNETAERNIIGGFWSRLAAFLIDFIIVVIIAALISIPISEALIKMGNWARVIGFVVGLAYYAMFNSSIGGGQTIGKRVMSLEVVGANGRPISLEKSTLRYAVFMLPVLLNGMIFPAYVPMVVGTVLPVLVAGILLASCYLVAFNSHTRQAVHDLVAGTYVVKSSNKSRHVNAQPIWKTHWFILSGSLVLLFAIAAAMTGWALKLPSFRRMSLDIKAVSMLPDVQSTNISINTMTMTGRPSSTSMSVNVIWSGDPNNDQAMADQVSEVIYKTDPALKQYSSLHVILTRGFNMGFWSEWSSNNFRYTSDDAKPSAPDSSESTQP